MLIREIGQRLGMLCLPVLERRQKVNFPLYTLDFNTGNESTVQGKGRCDAESAVSTEAERLMQFSANTFRFTCSEFGAPSSFYSFRPSFLHFQIENLEKSLKDTSGSSAASISSRTRQVKELSDEVGIVDRELAAVAVEREETSLRLNSKRMNHIATLRELGA